MRTRVCAAVIVSALSLFPADTRESLIERYGAPTVDARDKHGSETFLVRRDMEASVQYGASRHVCSIVIRPARAARPLDSIENSMAPKEVSEVLEELVPQTARGARRASGPLHISCDDFLRQCGGVEQDWDKLMIHRNGDQKSEQCATVRWKRDECNFVPHADIGCALEDMPNGETR